MSRKQHWHRWLSVYKDTKNLEENQLGEKTRDFIALAFGITLFIVGPVSAYLDNLIFGIFISVISSVSIVLIFRNPIVRLVSATLNFWGIYSWVPGLALLVIACAATALIMKGQSSPSSDADPPISTEEATDDSAPPILFQEDFCEWETANWITGSYTDEFATWTPRFEKSDDDCRLYLEATMLSEYIGWYRLYENAASFETGQNKYDDFNLVIYSRLLHADNPDEVRLSFHFRIGSGDDGYPNYWLYLNNDQEYCLYARNPSTETDGCLLVTIENELMHWIRDEAINPLSEGNRIQIRVYSSEIRIFFLNHGEVTEAAGSPFSDTTISKPGGFALGIRASEGDNVRVEYKDMTIFEESR